MFDIRPPVVLSEGLVVLRVEYVVVEVVSPSDLGPFPTYSDCVTSSPLSKNLQTLTANRRGYIMDKLMCSYCTIQQLNTHSHMHMNTCLEINVECNSYMNMESLVLLVLSCSSRENRYTPHYFQQC